MRLFHPYCLILAVGFSVFLSSFFQFLLPISNSKIFLHEVDFYHQHYFRFTIPTEINYENGFRVRLVLSLDLFKFDFRSVKRLHIHIAHPDGR